MNPYTILGISTTASDQEIKRAYRTLVKRYHPDSRSSESSHEQIVAINYAYDILSDPEKRAQYDRGFAAIYFEPPPQEDPMEVYKREFKRKRWEREKKEREEARARKTAIYRVLRWIHFAVLTFGTILILQDLLADETWYFWHVVMTVNAAYICYQRELNDTAYKLAQYTLFIFVITLLVTFWS
jgi:DnaJ-domain-containing protein 1